MHVDLAHVLPHLVVVVHFVLHADVDDLFIDVSGRFLQVCHHLSFFQIARFAEPLLELPDLLLSLRAALSHIGIKVLEATVHFDHRAPNLLIILLHEVVGGTALIFALGLCSAKALIKFVNGMYALGEVIVVFFAEHAVDHAGEDARSDVTLEVVVGGRQVPVDVRAAPVACREHCFDQLFSSLFVLIVIEEYGYVSI